MSNEFNTGRLLRHDQRELGVLSSGAGSRLPCAMLLNELDDARCLAYTSCKPEGLQSNGVAMIMEWQSQIWRRWLLEHQKLGTCMIS